MQLRKIPETFPFKIRTSGAMTLILVKVDPSDAPIIIRGMEFENSSPLGKDKLVSDFLERPYDYKLLLAWTGQYKTDIFSITPQDLEKFYK